jgi:hypothetical protein
MQSEMLVLRSGRCCEDDRLTESLKYFCTQRINKIESFLPNLVAYQAERIVVMSKVVMLVFPNDVGFPRR